MATDTRRGRSAETAEIRALLQDRAEALACHLAPDGHRSGKYWLARNPTRADAHRGSFWIVVGSGDRGTWADEATGDGASLPGTRNGRWRGDVLGLVGYCLRSTDFREVMDWSRDWLGIARLPEADRRRLGEQARQRAEAEAAARARTAGEERARNRKRALGLWLAGTDKLAGTPAETYLREARGIDLAALAEPPRALRYGVRWHRESGLELPCILAHMTGPDDKMWALHCTFLRPDGRDKADVEPNRKFWPSGWPGSAIRLAKGETGMRPREAAGHGALDTLALCEGVEDGLSIALACPKLRVWAVGSLGNLATVVLPACSDEIVVQADNDWGKPQAQAALDKALAALGAQGRLVKVARSHIGKDANDALRGRAA